MPNLLSIDVISTLQETRMLVRCRVPVLYEVGNQGGNADTVRPFRGRTIFLSLLF